jgi:hypothetical protein
MLYNIAPIFNILHPALENLLREYTDLILIILSTRQKLKRGIRKIPEMIDMSYFDWVMVSRVYT